MALSDTLSELTQKGPAQQNRVDILLDRLREENPADYEALQTALKTKSVRGVVLTAALRKEYGRDSVRERSVDDWRRRNLREINGL
jgi:primosomal protein N''